VPAADRDRQLLAQLRHTLARYGFDVQGVGDHRELLVEAADTRPDVVLLDADLPGSADALAVTVRLLAHRLAIPVVLGTGTAVPTFHATRDLGAAACVDRPYRLDQIVNCLAGWLGAPSPLVPAVIAGTDPISVGDLDLDPAGYRLTRHGRLVLLPLREFELLARLMAHPNEVISRDRLAREVWGAARMPDSNTVSVHMARLRRRLSEPPSSCCRIDTVRGLGYRLLCGG